MLELEIKQALDSLKRAKKRPSTKKYKNKFWWSQEYKCFFTKDIWNPVPHDFFYGDRHLFWWPPGRDVMDDSIKSLKGEILEEKTEIDFGLDLFKGLKWLIEGQELEQTMYYWSDDGEEFLITDKFMPLNPEDTFVIENWEFRDSLFFSEYQCYVLLLRFVKKFWCGVDVNHHKTKPYWEEEFTGLENTYTLRIGEWEINQILINSLLKNRSFVEYSGVTIWQEDENEWKIIVR